MYKMLIVEDEYYTREGIKRKINWQEYDIEIIGSAENGIEGIKMVKELKPDIVLTDIRMKAMDGLSMIEELKKANVNCKYIIMSGYKVFEYAKKALEEGIEFYLLKPISNELLIEAVQKIKLLLDKSQQDVLAQKLEQCKYFIKNLLNNCKQEIDCNIHNIHIKDYFVAIIRFDRPFINYQKDEFEIFKVLLQQRENISVCPLNDRESLVMFYNEENGDMAIRRISSALKSKLGVDICIGVGHKFNSLGDFVVAKEQASLALQYRLYEQEKKAIVYFESIKNYRNKIDNKFVKIENEIIHAIDNCSKDSIMRIIANTYEEISTVKYLPQDIYNWFKHLYMNILNLMKQLGHSEDSILEESYNHIVCLDSNSDFKLPEIIKTTENFCLYCVDILEENRKGHISKNIKDIIKYIDSHYMEDITLEQLEKTFYTEFTYLSRLFKKETGKSYVQYLTEKRIKKAKELMSDPNLTIYEISLKVSYTDAKYFSQLFKKIEGVTPSEYRANLLKQ